MHAYNCCQIGIELSKRVYLACMCVKIEHRVGGQIQDLFQNAYQMVRPAETWATTEVKIANLI